MTFCSPANFYWVCPESPYGFFSIKDVFFIFTNNFIVLGHCEFVGNLPHGIKVDCSQWMSQFDCYQLQLVYPMVKHHSVRNLHQETSQTTFDTFNHSRNLLHTLQKSFFTFQLCFYLSWRDKASYAKNVYFLSSSILKWLHKNSPILMFF